MCMQHFFRWTFRFHIVAHEIKTLIRKLQIPGVEFQVSQRMLILGFCKLLAPGVSLSLCLFACVRVRVCVRARVPLCHYRRPRDLCEKEKQVRVAEKRGK